jgi:biopolymer transport protein ExbD
MARRGRSTGDERGIDMTPMIDVVFQLIIFFIVTIKLEKDMYKEIRLADAEHGPAITEEDPRTVVITVDGRGQISIGAAVMSQRQLQGIMQNAVNTHGYNVPVLIRGDKDAHHSHVRAAMDACAAVGVWRMKFAAVKEYALQ